MSLIVGIGFLFIISAVSPMVIGYGVRIEKWKLMEENYALNRCWDSGLISLEEYKQETSSTSKEVYSTSLIKTEDGESQSTIFSGGLMESAWPMKCHDIHHTSQSPYSTANNSGYEIWRFKTEHELGGTIESSAVIGEDETIYFGSMGCDRSLYALNPNGTKKWSYQVGLMIWSAPAIAEDGTIYVGSWDDYLHAVNPNGTRKWTFCAYDSISSSPAIAENGTIYFGSMGFPEYGGCNIFAVNPNGTEKWRYQTGDMIFSDPAIGNDCIIYIGSGDRYLYAMNPNGTLRWRFGTGGEIHGHPSIADDGTIYIPSYDDYLYAVYPNGTMRWKVNTGYGSASSAAIAEDGTLYIGTDKLYAIYPNGTIKWSLDVGGDILSATPAISADGTIYVSTGTGKSIVAVSPNGTEKWRKQICNLRADSSPIIGEDGTVYVGSSWKEDDGDWTGFLHAFNELDPNAPYEPTITGPTDGKAGVEYEYTFVTEDPNGDDVYYYIEWGDRAYEYLIGPYASGEEITLTHKWMGEGTYTIKARGIDTHNLCGPWGELEIKMPFSYTSPFLRFLDRFPRAFPILRHLLGT